MMIIEYRIFNNCPQEFTVTVLLTQL
jgi:hypothetical protein